MKRFLALLAIVALMGGSVTGCQSDGTQPKLTLADYAPLIGAFIQAVDAYADAKLGLPDTPETRLLLATRPLPRSLMTSWR